MSSLLSRQKEILLQVARREVYLAAGGQESPNEIPVGDDLMRPAGAFVTLHCRRNLRGCMGRLPSTEPLIAVVAQCAKLAATQDPRFAPVRLDELAGINVEISVLSPLEDATIDQIRPGTHGLVVTQDAKRGVLLPQVAERFRWDAVRFLEETCVKAELDRNAWKQPGTKIQVFTAEIFREPAANEQILSARSQNER
jgi:AmmeMemoRadiSam system protein A